MRKYNLRKSSIIMTIIVLILISTLVHLSVGTESEPFELVREMRKNLEEYKLISSKQTDDGIFLYSQV